VLFTYPKASTPGCKSYLTSYLLSPRPSNLQLIGSPLPHISPLPKAYLLKICPTPYPNHAHRPSHLTHHNFSLHVNHRHQTSLPLPRRLHRPDRRLGPRHLRPVDGLAQGQHHLPGQAEAALPAAVRPASEPDRRHRAQEGAQGHDPRRVCRRQGGQSARRASRQSRGDGECCEGDC
jgi:hypothetical protein